MKAVITNTHTHTVSSESGDYTPHGTKIVEIRESKKVRRRFIGRKFYVKEKKVDHTRVR
jgi:hypothetical protein